MNSVACVTAITGGYDLLHAHPDTPDVDFWCFTDNPELAIRDDWQVRLLPPSNSPRMSAKAPKILPHRFPELWSYDYTIWVDGNVTIQPGFLDCLEDLGPDGFALHAHPSRDCIYEEALATGVVVPEKYDLKAIEFQIQHYRWLDFPEHYGLWACGSFARTPSAKLDRMMDQWYDEITHWSVQDQLSLPPVARGFDVRPATWPYNQNSSPWFRLGPHGR